MCEHSPQLCDGALAITLHRSPASNCVLRTMRLARLDDIIFECMSYVTIAEADVRSNGIIKPAMAVTSFDFVCTRRLGAQSHFGK